MSRIHVFTVVKVHCTRINKVNVPHLLNMFSNQMKREDLSHSQMSIHIAIVVILSSVKIRIVTSTRKM